MTPHEITIRRNVQRARLAYAQLHRSGDILGAIKASKAVDRFERELCRYLGFDTDATAT